MATGETLRVGDRVQVRPESKVLAGLRGEWGRIEAIYEGGVRDGWLLVRLDKDGTTLGCGPEAITNVEQAHG